MGKYGTACVGGRCGRPCCRAGHANVTNEPLDWTEGHHLTGWAEGGETTLANASLLCRFHHRTVHHGDWQARLGPDGRPEFLPPVTVDPQRRPRRNVYHHRDAYHHRE